MSFISYAQNFEDIMLWRALKHVKNGFYIDIGANDPEIDSVTKSMYDLAWNGINCEPVSYWFDKLEKERPNDINIQVAIGGENTELKFYEVVNTGLSTLHEKTAKEHAKKLGFEIKEYFVQVKTLTSICKEKDIDIIHFLKIDVEGAEKYVLNGINFKQIRPWIIVIEATKPMTKNIDFLEWEDLIVSENYHFVYFDGLNRFYIANEHAELDQSFSTPPNVFDKFILASEHRLWDKSIKLEKKLRQLEHQSFLDIEAANKKTQEWWEKATLTEKKLKQLEHQSFLDIEAANKKTQEWWEKATLTEKKLKQLEHQSFLDIEAANKKTQEWWEKATFAEKKLNEVNILKPYDMFQKLLNKIKG